MFKRKIFLKLGLEIIAIVFGISISFWISEVSIDRNEKIQRNRILNSVLIESSEIKKYCEERLKIWNQDVEIYKLLLAKELNLEKLKEIAISKNRVEYNLIYYREFNPPMNRYASILNTGGLKYIESENVKETITRLHNFNYSKVVSTVDYEKKITQQITELITKENPSLIIQGNDAKINFESYLKSLHQFISKNKSLESNLTIQLKYFKARISSLKFYFVTLEELQDELEKEIKLSL